MSATIYRVKQWCRMSPDEITSLVHGLCGNSNTYSGEELYQEVEKQGRWESPTEDDDSVLIWNGDDAGPIVIDGEEVGLFVHFDEDKGVYDWACTYEL